MNVINETRKEQVERESRNFLIDAIIEKGGGWISKEDAPDYISEFFWHKNCLYASIDALKNPAIIATLKKGIIV